MNKEAAHSLARVQIAMWIGDSNIRCISCGHIYESVDDFISRDPMLIGRDHKDQMLLIDISCFEDLVTLRDKHVSSQV